MGQKPHIVSSNNVEEINRVLKNIQHQIQQGVEKQSIPLASGNSNPLALASVAPASNVMVELAMPSIFTVGGSPVYNTGKFTVGLVDESPAMAWMGPSSTVPGAPIFRYIRNTDLQTAPASATLLGAVKLSTVPNSSANPIALGNNDPLLSQKYLLATAYPSIPNAVNLGALANGVLMQTVTGGSAGIGIASQAYLRSQIGSTTVGNSLLSLTVPATPVYLQVNSDGTVSELTVATFWASPGGSIGTTTPVQVSATVLSSGYTSTAPVNFIQAIGVVTDTASAVSSGCYVNLTLTPSASSAANCYGFQGSAIFNGAFPTTGGVYGFNGGASHSGTAACSSVIAGRFATTYTGSGGGTNLRGIFNTLTATGSGTWTAAVATYYGSLTLNNAGLQINANVYGYYQDMTLTALAGIGGSIYGNYQGPINSVGVTSKPTSIVGRYQGAITAAGVTNAYAYLTADITGATNNFQMKLGAGFSYFSDTTEATSPSASAIGTDGGIYASKKIITASTLQGAGAQITGLTASRAVVTDASSNLAASATTATELGYLNGVSSPTGTGALVLATGPTVSGLKTDSLNMTGTGYGRYEFAFSKTAIADNSATNILTVTTTDESGSTDGGSWALRLELEILHPSTASGSGASAEKYGEYLVRHLNIGAGTVTNSAVEVLKETTSIASASATRDIGTITVAITSTSNYIQTISLTVDTTGSGATTYRIAGFAKLIWSGYTTAPVMAAV